MKMISFKKEKMKKILLKKIENKYVKDKNCHKVRDHCHYTGEHRGAVNNICYLKNSVPKKIPITLHDGSNYDYQFIIKELAEEFKKHFTCLGENTQKYITFTVLIEKKVKRIDKNGEEIESNISYILHFNDSARFMASSLSDLVNKPPEVIHTIKCKCADDSKKCEICGIT